MFDNHYLNSLFLFQAMTMKESEARHSRRRPKPKRPSLWQRLRVRLARIELKPKHREQRRLPAIGMRPVHGESC